MGVKNMANNNTSPKKALVARVNIGTISIEGLMLPDGSFAISLQQLRELAFPSISQTNAKRELQSACGKDFQLIKCATEISNNPQWIISLEQLNFCLTELAFKGHKEARSLVRIFSGLALHQLFCDAFGVKFEKEERQKWLKERMFHKKQYHPLLTKWLQKDGCEEGWEYGQKVNQFKTKCGLPLITVDSYNSEQLHILNNAEAIYDAMRRSGKAHQEAMMYVV